jgi:deazaflavin-dependent oxidoreductase (nitroreductase family)
MTCTNLASVADKKVLYLTTVGRRTGLPREIEIWFVIWSGRLYLFAEMREAAGWVKNIRRNPSVAVRVGECRSEATARVLDRHSDRRLWDQVAPIARRKYGWSDGLPVEITLLPSPVPHFAPRS